MKYCEYCGNELVDEAVLCPKCGCAVRGSSGRAEGNGTLSTVAKVFMLITCIMWGLLGCMLLLATTAIVDVEALVAIIYFIPLAWCIPMTVSYWNKCALKEDVGIGFKVCTLLFVNTIAGILMLVDGNK